MRHSGPPIRHDEDIKSSTYANCSLDEKDYLEHQAQGLSDKAVQIPS